MTESQCGWCSAKIVGEPTAKMHEAPLCRDCSNLVCGGQGRTPDEIMQGAKVALWIWMGLIVLIVIFAVIGAGYQYD